MGPPRSRCPPYLAASRVLGASSGGARKPDLARAGNAGEGELPGLCMRLCFVLVLCSGTPRRFARLHVTLPLRPPPSLLYLCSESIVLKSARVVERRSCTECVGGEAEARLAQATAMAEHADAAELAHLAVRSHRFECHVYRELQES